MSEISVLSHQYESLREATDRLNDAVILLKKDRLLGKRGSSKKYPNLAISPDELNDARGFLIVFLKRVQAALKNGDDENMDTFIPGSLMEEYKKRILSNEPYLIRHLTEAINLLENKKPVQDSHFRVFDNLLSALDVERTVVFKKLRTGRHG